METISTIYQKNERVYDCEIDPQVARDLEILQKRQAAFDSQDGPREGDFVRFSEDGTLRRLAYAHPDYGWGIQPTHAKFGLGSFHISSAGHCSYSGAMDSRIPIEYLTLLDEKIDGNMWFFSGGSARAHAGVHVSIPCRVYEYKPITQSDSPRYWETVTDD
jgi:hypothetical protein